MNQRLLSMTAIALTCWIAGAQAATLKEGSKPMHEAVEGAAIKFYLEADLTGVAVARQCRSCEPMRFRVTPKMSVVDADNNHAPVEWNATFDVGDRKADIIYFPETKIIDEVILHGDWD